MQDRFADVSEIKFIELANSSKFKEYSTSSQFLTKRVNELLQHYPSFLQKKIGFVQNSNSFTAMKSFRNKPLFEIVKKMVMDDSHIDVFPEAYTDYFVWYKQFRLQVHR